MNEKTGQRTVALGTSASSPEVASHSAIPPQEQRSIYQDIYEGTPYRDLANNGIWVVKRGSFTRIRSYKDIAYLIKGTQFKRSDVAAVEVPIWGPDSYTESWTVHNMHRARRTKWGYIDVDFFKDMTQAARVKEIHHLVDHLDDIGYQYCIAVSPSFNAHVFLPLTDWFLAGKQNDEGRYSGHYAYRAAMLQFCIENLDPFLKYIDLQGFDATRMVSVPGGKRWDKGGVYWPLDIHSTINEPFYKKLGLGEYLKRSSYPITTKEDDPILLEVFGEIEHGGVEYRLTGAQLWSYQKAKMNGIALTQEDMKVLIETRNTSDEIRQKKDNNFNTFLDYAFDKQDGMEFHTATEQIWGKRDKEKEEDMKRRHASKRAIRGYHEKAVKYKNHIQVVLAYMLYLIAQRTGMKEKAWRMFTLSRTTMKKLFDEFGLKQPSKRGMVFIREFARGALRMEVTCPQAPGISQCLGLSGRARINAIKQAERITPLRKIIEENRKKKEEERPTSTKVQVDTVQRKPSPHRYNTNSGYSHTPSQEGDKDNVSIKSPYDWYKKLKGGELDVNCQEIVN